MRVYIGTMMERLKQGSVYWSEGYSFTGNALLKAHLLYVHAQYTKSGL